MIGSLRGTVIDRSMSEVIIEVQGVGYRVVGSARLVASSRVGDEMLVHVHHHIREDASTLYGFPSRDERQLFETLIGTHGVGPALALAIQSVHTPHALKLAVATEDVAALCAVPGVGKKTAQRLIIELASQLDVDGLATVDVTDHTPEGAAPSGRDDAREALASLGYGPDEVRRALHGLSGDDSSELLRAALRRLAEG